MFLFKRYALGDCATIKGNDLPATAQGKPFDEALLTYQCILY